MHRPVLAFASIVFTTLVVGVLFAVECSTPALAANQDLLDKAKAAIAISGIQCDLADAREISLTNESAPNSSRGGRRGGGMGGGGMGGGSRGGGSRFDDDSGGGIAMAKPGAQRTAIYEVACHEGLGFVVILGPSGPSGAANSDGAPSQAPAVSDAPKILAEPFNCLELEESPDKLARKLRCQLDANKDQSHGLESLVASVNITCPITARHSLGHTEKASFFEIACQNGEGYILTTSRALRFDQTVRAIPCYSVPPDAGMSCTLTDVAGTSLAPYRL